MTKRSVSISVALFSALALFAAIAFVGCGGPQGNGNANANHNGAVTSPTKPVAATTVDCNGVGHADILKAVYAALDTSKYASEEWQFNITEKGTILKIEGWSTDMTEINQLLGSTAINCTVESNGFYPTRQQLESVGRAVLASCANNYKPCGDVCIPESDDCKITSTQKNVASKPSMASNSNSSANSNTKPARTP